MRLVFLKNCFYKKEECIAHSAAHLIAKTEKTKLQKNLLSSYAI